MRRLPVILTLLLIAAGFALTQRERWLSWIRSDAGPQTPETVIWRSSDAARNGDSKSYLDCFHGTLRDKLERAAQDMGQDKFSAYLKKLDQELTGIAVSDMEQPDSNKASLRVEFVYQGRSDVQKYEFQRIDGTWRIVGIGDAEWLRGL